MTVPMELIGVRVDVPSNTPVMVMREVEGDHRVLAIMIGGPEAQAIAFALDGVETRRPLTHDLITNLLDEMGAPLERIVISALRDDVYYADLVIKIGGVEHVVSARPSDAVAIAVRADTPIFASEEVLAEAGFVEEPDVGLDDDEVAQHVVEEFKEFIEHVNPEDFAS